MCLHIGGPQLLDVHKCTKGYSFARSIKKFSSILKSLVSWQDALYNWSGKNATFWMKTDTAHLKNTWQIVDRGQMGKKGGCGGAGGKLDNCQEGQIANVGAKPPLDMWWFDQHAPLRAEWNCVPFVSFPEILPSVIRAEVHLKSCCTHLLYCPVHRSWTDFNVAVRLVDPTRLLLLH